MPQPTWTGEVAIAGDNSFMLTDGLGDMAIADRHGLFHADTRFLSRYRFRLDGVSLRPVGKPQVATDHAIFRLTNAGLSALPAETLRVVRHRHLNSRLTEDWQIVNRGVRPISTVLRLDVGADFADVLELRAVPAAKLRPSAVCPPPDWRHAFLYSREHVAWRTLVRWSMPGWVTADGVAFEIALSPGADWRCQLEVALERAEGVAAPRAVAVEPAKRSARLWAGFCPANGTASPGEVAPVMRRVVERARADLRVLRLTLSTGERIVGAGMPNFMTLFGRDSLFTAYLTLPLGPELTADVLSALAGHQGLVDDAGSDQEPGKMPHEVRTGELALFGDLPHCCYYGSVDATPLFLVLFSEYLRQTDDIELRERLWPAAEACLASIDRYGDRDGDGFVEYWRRAPRGLNNQGWKDSWDAIAFADGRLAEGPIALCEVQGYVYDAKLRMAELYRQRGNPERGAALEGEAHLLQQRFEAAFWLPDAGTYALALDGSKCPVDAVSSNPAHCLWSGIVAPERAEHLAERLLAGDLFSGWGLRTLSTSMTRWDPLSYHNGSVWPHDTVLAAAGLLRYGHRSAARRLLLGLMAAATHFPDQRLPELFAGFPRTPHGCPIPYPEANAPQAWSAGATIAAASLLARV